MMLFLGTACDWPGHVGDGPCCHRRSQLAAVCIALDAQRWQKRDRVLFFRLAPVRGFHSSLRLCATFDLFWRYLWYDTELIYQWNYISFRALPLCLAAWSWVLLCMPGSDARLWDYGNPNFELAVHPPALPQTRCVDIISWHCAAVTPWFALCFALASCRPQLLPLQHRACRTGTTFCTERSCGP